MTTPKLGKRDALIVVDVQNDFCPGGALAVAGGDRVVPVLNQWLAAASKRGARIVASRDWHPPDHVSFRARGGPWPAHCVQHTPGAEFHPELRLPKNFRLVSKGTKLEKDDYSAFANRGLARELKAAGVQRLWVGGLALDVCVRATVLDGLAAGFEVHLIEPATRAVDPRSGKRRTLRELAHAGCIIEKGVPDASLGSAKRTGNGPVHRSLRANDGSGVRRRATQRDGRVRADVPHPSHKSQLRSHRRPG